LTPTVKLESLRTNVWKKSCNSLMRFKFKFEKPTQPK
jgi:hypothetical protein